MRTWGKRGIEKLFRMPYNDRRPLEHIRKLHG